MTKLKSTQWHLILTLTLGIALPRGTDNVMCHTRNLTCDIFNFFFFKNLNFF